MVMGDLDSNIGDNNADNCAVGVADGISAAVALSFLLHTVW